MHNYDGVLTDIEAGAIIIVVSIRYNKCFNNMLYSPWVVGCFAAEPGFYL